MTNGIVVLSCLSAPPFLPRLLPLSTGVHTREAQSAPSALPDALMVGLWRGHLGETLEMIRKEGGLLHGAGSWMALG